MASNLNPTASALFNNPDESFAEEFRDKVGAIHEHFDCDKDGYLNFAELKNLQSKTSGASLDEDQYVMVCKALGCHPSKGVSLPALRLTYAAEGTNLEEDYGKVFSEKSVKTSKDSTSPKQEDKVFEIGPGGFDISD